MADGTTWNQSRTQDLRDLIDFEGSDAFDWDPSALADWPNIAPAAATSLPAWSPDGEGIHA